MIGPRGVFLAALKAFPGFLECRLSGFTPGEFSARLQRSICLDVVTYPSGGLPYLKNDFLDQNL